MSLIRFSLLNKVTTRSLKICSYGKLLQTSSIYPKFEGVSQNHCRHFKNFGHQPQKVPFGENLIHFIVTMGIVICFLDIKGIFGKFRPELKSPEDDQTIESVHITQTTSQNK